MDENSKASMQARATLGQALQGGNGTNRSRQGRPAAGAWREVTGARTRTGVILLADDQDRALRVEGLLQAGGALRLQEFRMVASSVAELVDALLALTPGADTAAVLVDCDLPAADLARVARRYRASHRDCPLVFRASEKDGGAIDVIIAGGAGGVVLRDYDAEAIASALRVVLCGQRYRPYVTSTVRRRDAAVEPERKRVARPVFDGQADKPLSHAEMDVCRLVAQHLSDREIAQLRGTGRGTVRTQVTNLMRKLGCKRRDEAGEIYRRLYEIDDDAVQSALRGESVNLDWLVEFMDTEQVKKGTVLFRKGQTARKLYYLESGDVRLHEIATVMKPGVLFGEIGIFAPDQKRTFTAECVTDVRLRSMDAARVWRYYQLKPEFAVQMLCLITRRLLADIDRLRG